MASPSATTTLYGDISPRTAAFAAKQLLERGQYLLLTERFGQAKPIPQKHTQTMKFRRYEKLTRATSPLSEGTTPPGQKLTKTDVSVALQQYGDWIELTDVIMDTHEDPILRETSDLLGEQAAETLEEVRLSFLQAGTTVAYTNGVSRTAVNTVIDRGDLRMAVRTLKNQLARHMTSLVAPSPNFATQAVEPAFWAICHSDLEHDIRSISGFVPASEYSRMQGIEAEIGVVEQVRFCLSPIISAWAGGGAAGGSNVLETGGSADVYPILIFARNAYGIVPLAGKNAVRVMVLNPNKPRGGDPLGQLGSAGWKLWHACVILNDNWMYRIESACTDQPS